MSQSATIERTTRYTRGLFVKRFPQTEVREEFFTLDLIRDEFIEWLKGCPVDNTGRVFLKGAPSPADNNKITVWLNTWRYENPLQPKTETKTSTPLQSSTLEDINGDDLPF